MSTPLVRFLLRHCAGGVFAGWVTLGGLIGTDVGGLRTLILASDLGVIAAIMLLIGFAVTFGSAAMGAAVMGLGRDDPPGTQRRYRWTPAPVTWKGSRAGFGDQRLVPVRIRRLRPSTGR